MDAKHSGALTELTACAWFLKQGYEVFRNVSSRGWRRRERMPRAGTHTPTGPVSRRDGRSFRGCCT